MLSLTAATAREVGLPAGTPVVAGAADGPCANLGTGAITPGIAALSVGTSGAVRGVVGAPQVDEDRTLFCYALTDEHWVIGGAMSNGGSIMRWAGDALAADVQAAAGVVFDSLPEAEWQETEAKARAVLRAAEIVESGAGHGD